MNKLLRAMKEETNRTTTWNGAAAYKSTNSKILDLFSMGGNAKGEKDLEKLRMAIRDAFNEDTELALAVTFYLADVRGGQGVRNVMRTALQFLTERYPAQTRRLIALLAEYTRWDMLYEFVGTPLERDAFKALHREVISAIREHRNSLVFKWLKSVNASSEETNRLGRLTAKYFNMSEKNYRQMLSKYRRELGVVEVYMSAGQWRNIEYGKLPSKAGLLYREAFKNHDFSRYNEFVEAVVRGEAKMNMGRVYPYEIVNKYKQGRGASHCRAPRMVYDASLEAAWKSLEDIFIQDGDTITVCDVSGSMFNLMSSTSTTQYIDMSIALAIYFAERAKGAFANHVISFDSNPRLIYLPEKASLADKIEKVFEGAGGSTNIDAVFKLILDTAKRNRVSQSEMPKTVMIVSDMQFNSVTNGRQTTNFQNWRAMFRNAGYEMPQIIYWNMNTADNVPVTADTQGTVLISGSSPKVLEYIHTGKFLTPFEQMLEVVDRPRYVSVVNAFRGM